MGTGIKGTYRRRKWPIYSRYPRVLPLDPSGAGSLEGWGNLPSAEIVRRGHVGQGMCSSHNIVMGGQAKELWEL